MEPIRQGRVLRVKTGYNPNSSSVGTNLAPLLFAGSLAAMAAPLLFFWASNILARRKKGEENP
ncbi:MAG: hypothetical protein KKA60_09720 [Proteobacteria bacterium]|nr:hypothetical protein [Pseudomonadota bacterium]